MFDTLITNAKIYSLEKEGEFYGAMGIQAGKITQLFRDSPENSSQLAKQIVDAKGHTIVPGFTDFTYW